MFKRGAGERRQREEDASCSVWIEPLWYETSAARLLMLVAAGLVALTVYRVRLHARARRELLVLRVAERTQALAREVDERRTAEDALEHLSEELDLRVRERTEQVEVANAALRRSEERYALAVQGANDGLWDWDVLAGYVYYSPRWMAMLGYEAHEVEPTPEAWFSRVYPDDLPRLHEAVDACLAGETTYINHEYRMIGSDGIQIWVQCRGISLVDASGRLARIAGAQTDITGTKRAQEELLHNATHDALTGLPNRTSPFHG